MSRQPIKPEEWWLGAATLMVKYDLSLREVAQELGIELTIAEADAIQKRKLFRECLEEARIRYYQELGSCPSVSKETITGAMFKLASRLEQEEPYKSADVLLKLAKVKGLVGSDPDYLQKIFSVLSAKELEEVKQNLIEQRQQQPQPAEKP